MNKRTGYIMAASAVLLIIAVILAVIVRSNVPEQDGLVIRTSSDTFTIAWKDLDKEAFSGEIINGKGEISSREYRGIALSELFSSFGIEIHADTRITAESEDHYTANLSGEEVMREGCVYIAVISDNEMIASIDREQGAQLIVYGDPDSKRQVRYLKTIILEEPH